MSFCSLEKNTFLLLQRERKRKRRLQRRAELKELRFLKEHKERQRLKLLGKCQNQSLCIRMRAESRFRKRLCAYKKSWRLTDVRAEAF